MSDFDDDLLALAEGSAPKKSKSTKSKRKREVVQSEYAHRPGPRTTSF